MQTFRVNLDTSVAEGGGVVALWSNASNGAAVDNAEASVSLAGTPGGYGLYLSDTLALTRAASTFCTPFVHVEDAYSGAGYQSVEVDLYARRTSTVIPAGYDIYIGMSLRWTYNGTTYNTSTVRISVPVSGSPQLLAFNLSLGAGKIIDRAALDTLKVRVFAEVRGSGSGGPLSPSCTVYLDGAYIFLRGDWPAHGGLMA